MGCEENADGIFLLNGGL